MPDPLRLLIVDDLRDYADMLALLVAQTEPDTRTDIVDAYDAALLALGSGRYDVAIVDYWLDRQDGVTLLGATRAQGIDTPVIILTGAGGEEIAADVLKRGAADYLSKAAVSPDALARAIRHAVALRDRERRRRDAEAALRASEARFRALVENSSDAVLLLDDRGSVSFLTSSAERHLGWPADALLGASIVDFVHPDDQERTRELFAQTLRRPGERVEAAVRFRHADGQSRDMEGVAVNRLDDPAVGGIVVNVRDVTERRRLEEQLRLAQKMEAVGQLAGGIAHDFNNLLTAILGYCSLLLEEAPQGSALGRDLEEIKHAGERAAMLTRQLLAFGRRQMLRPRVVDLNALVAKIEPVLRGVLGDTIDLVVSMPASIPAVKVDPASIEQVLVNLALNARDAMPGGGRLTVATRAAELPRDEIERVPSMPAGRYALLTFSDTGEGMDPETRARVFEPFFTTKEQGKGTGLGLATVYGIVKQSGGYIWVASEQGSGTTFTMYFPAQSAVESEGASAAASS